MRSAAAAIAWEFRQRHRWALIAAVTYVVLVAGYWLLFVETGATIRLDPPDGLAAFGVVPLSIAFFYILAVFSFGLAGDLAARQSIYPARMFALPVPTSALALWPMLYGSVAMALLWLTGWTFARWWRIELPLVWPGLLCVAFLVWTQVFTWKAYRFRGLRVIVTVAWLIALDVIVIVAIELKVRQPVLIAFLAPQWPLAYAAACLVLSRARRGDVPNWGFIRRRDRAATGATRTLEVFRSPARAQAWFEWRQHGWTLPMLVGLVAPFELLMLFLPGNNVPSIVLTTLIVVLLTPPFLAGFAAAAVSKTNPFVRDSPGVAPFIATRPVTSAAMIAAKLEMTIWSTLVTWLLLLVIVPVALIWSGTQSIVIDRAIAIRDAIGMPRAIVLAALVFGALLASTWKHLVQNLCIGLTGRDWLIKGSVFVSLLAVILVFPAVRLFTRGHGFALLWDWFQLVLVVLVGLKMMGAAWLAIRLGASGVLADRTLIGGAACWVVTVFALFGVFVWFADTRMIPHYVFLLIAILQVPLVRLSAAPLALAWNRHR